MKLTYIYDFDDICANMRQAATEQGRINNKRFNGEMEEGRR